MIWVLYKSTLLVLPNVMCHGSKNVLNDFNSLAESWETVFVGGILSRPYTDMLLKEKKMFNCDHYIYLPFRSNDQ